MKNAKPPLKIAFVYDDSLDGNEGVTRAIKNLGSWLKDRGHQVSYLVGETKTKSYDGMPVYSLAKNVGVVFNGNRLSIPLPASSRKIEQALAQEKPDVLHVQMPHSPFLAQKVINRAGPAAVAGTFHIYPANFVARMGSRLLKLMYLGGLRKFDEVVSVSPAAVGFAKSHYGLGTTVIPNSVNLKNYQNSEKNIAGRIVFLGRLVPRKGARQLIEAFSRVSENLPDAELLIAGDGPQRAELEGLVNKLSLKDRVKFLGYAAEEDKASLLASAEVACFPSLYGESFGIVLIEAMAAGAGAVLAGDNPGYRTVLSQQPELLVNPNDRQEFASRLEQLLTDKAKLEDLHKWLGQEVHKYDIETVGPQTEELYRRVIANSKKISHN